MAYMCWSFLGVWGWASFVLTYLQSVPTHLPFGDTYPGERCTAAVTKAIDLVQSFLGGPIPLDAADLGAAAHRVWLF